MADQDKDRTNQGSLAGSTSTGTPLSAGGAKTPGISTTTSSSAAGSSGGIDMETTGSGMAGRTSTTTDSIKAGSARLANEARQYAGDMANRAKEKSRTMFDQQKESAVGQVQSVAGAFRNTAGNLQGEGQDQVARYIGIVADQLESIGGRLREKDLDTLINDTQNMVRRSPGTFFAGSIVAGFLLARFLKSSSEHQSRSMELSRDDRVVPDETGLDSYASMGGGSAMPGASTGSTTASASAGKSSELGADGTPGTAQGTSTTGTSTSPLTGSNTGGPTYGNR